jgi:hypothetical protein
MRRAVTKGGLTLLRGACVNDVGGELGRKTSERTFTWMPVGPTVSCCLVTSRSTAQIPPVEQLFTPAPSPCDMAWQCAIPGCWTHCTAQTEDAAWETSSASNTATIVADGKRSLNSFSIPRLSTFLGKPVRTNPLGSGCGKTQLKSRRDG